MAISIILTCINKIDVLNQVQKCPNSSNFSWTRVSWGQNESGRAKHSSNFKQDKFVQDSCTLQWDELDASIHVDKKLKFFMKNYCLVSASRHSPLTKVSCKNIVIESQAMDIHEKTKHNT